MNFRIEQALLVVDPKGFLFDEIKLTEGKKLSLEEEYSTVSNILKSNWTLYNSNDIINLDWALGRLNHYLTNKLTEYNNFTELFEDIASEKFKNLQQSLYELLLLLEQTVKRIFFYEIHIYSQKFFGTFSFIPLYLNCDNFKILKLASDIELKFLQQQTQGRIIPEEYKSTRSYISKVLSLPLPFFKKSLIMFNQEQFQSTNLNIKLLTKNKEQINIDLKNIIIDNKQFSSSNIVKNLKLSLLREDEIKLIFYLKALKHWGNYQQLSYFIQICKNMYLTLDQVSKTHQLFWVTLYEDTLQILIKNKPSIVSINQIQKYCCPCPQIIQIIQNNCLKGQDYLSSLNFALKNTRDQVQKQFIQRTIQKKIMQLIQLHKWQYSEDIFEVLEHCDDKLIEKVFLQFQQVMMQSLKTGDVQIFKFQKSFIHFFRFYLSADNQNYYKRIINSQFLTEILNSFANSNVKQNRIRHFLFNQSFYFCQQIPGFGQYLNSMMSDSKTKQTIIQIYSNFIKNNQCLFKLNFKLVHRIVDNIYKEEKQNEIQNIQLCSLYWETNAKFLLFWGSRSYLEEEINNSEYYENILFKLLEILPELDRIHQNQQTSLLNYLKNKDKYDSNIVQHWLALLYYKNRSLSQSLLYSSLFLRDALTGFQFKQILNLVIKLFTPLNNIIANSNIEQYSSFSEQIQLVSSQFALQILQVVSNIKVPRQLDFQWTKNSSKVFKSFWLPDRSQFIKTLINTPIVPQNYNILSELRKVQFNVILFNCVIQKLNSNALKQISEIKIIQNLIFNIVNDIQYKLSPIFWESCLNEFYFKSTEITNEQNQDRSMLLRAIAQKQMITKNNSSLGFQRLQIIDKYLIIKQIKSFYQVSKFGNKKLFEKNIKRSLNFDTKGKTVEYQMLASVIQLIYVVQKYCGNSSDLEKKIKFSILSPVSIEQLNDISNKFTNLTKLFQDNSISLYVRKLNGLLIRQIHKYFISYLLHDCISFHHHYTLSQFNEMLTAHMKLQEVILTFIKSVTLGCEQSHSVYLQVLDSNITLYTTVMESNQTQEIKQPLKLYGQQLSQFTLSLINLLLFSTFSLQSRCRSSVLHILMLKYQSLTSTPKVVFNHALGSYLKDIFAQFLQFKYNQTLTNLLLENKQSLITKYSTLDLCKIELICTQAMLINLIGRNNYKDMCSGVSQMFSGVSTISYLKYLEIVSQQLTQLNYIKDVDMETLVIDVFGSLDNILQNNSNHQQTIPLLFAILDKLQNSTFDFKQIKNNIIRQVLKGILQKPSDSSFQLLKKMDKYGSDVFLPRMIVLQSQLLEFKSPLHLLNVLYYDRHNFKNIRQNWHMILENYDQTITHDRISEISSGQSDDLFLKNYQMKSEKLEILLNQYIDTCLKYLNQRKKIADCYLLHQMILGIGIKLPSLIQQIFQHKLNIKQLSTKHQKIFTSWNTIHKGKQSITFFEFLLDLVQINHRLVVEFGCFISKTNSGFKMSNEHLIISNNFILTTKFKSSLLERVKNLYEMQYSEKKIAAIFGTLKTFEYLVKSGDKMLFGLYDISSPPREALNQYYKSIIKPFLYETQVFVISHFNKCANPLIQQSLVYLLGEVLKDTFEKNEIDYQAEDNMKYYLNNYIFSVLKGYEAYDWKLVQPANKIIQTLHQKDVNNIQKEIFDMDKYKNSFLNKEYNVFKIQQHQLLQINNQALVLKMSILGFGSHIVKLETSFRELNRLTEQREQFSDLPQILPSYDETKAKKSKIENINSVETSHHNENSNSVRSHENSADFMMMNDEFVEDQFIEDGIDETKQQQQQQQVSSFGQLISSSITDTAVKQLIRRVNKLQIMEDLQLGKQINNKLQFLSNDELLKLSLLAEGKLLLEIQHQKEFRGFVPTPSKYGNLQYEQPIHYRYLDELYPGCRKILNIQELAETRMCLVPQLPQQGLLKIIQMYFESFNDEQCHRRIQKTIHILSLQPTNLLFFAHSLFFIISMKQLELPLLKQWFGWMNLQLIKSNVFELMGHLFEHRIGLVLWIMGQMNNKTLQLNGQKAPKYLQQISKKLNREQYFVRLIQIVALNSNIKKSQPNLQRLLEIYNDYLDEKQGRFTIDYPWFDTPELSLASDNVIEQLVIQMIKRRKRLQDGSSLGTLVKLLLKVYPNCYQSLMLHFIHQTQNEFKKVIENQIILHRKFLAINSLNSDTFEQIQNDPQVLMKLVEMYVTFTIQKTPNDHLLKEASHYLRDIYHDMFLTVVPWFKQWRFRVENREELGKHFQEVREFKQKTNGAKITKDYKLLEQYQNHLKRLDHSLKDWKSQHKNQFLKTYIKPIHQCFSTHLITAFKKSVDLLDEVSDLFNPTQDNFKIVEPVYRSQSIVWQGILAYMSVYLEQSTNSYHTMSKLSTRQHLKDVEESNRRKSRKSRKSIRMSLANNIDGGFATMSLMLRLSNKITLVSHYLKQGSGLIKALAQYGSLDIKLKSIKRRKSGVIRQIQIDRSRIWFDSILNIDQQFVDRDIRIKFKGQIGIDYGGLTKQWLTSISQQLFNPEFGLFELSVNKLTIQPSRYSNMVPQHLMHFKKLGLLVGKSLIQDWTLQINFTKSFLKHLLGNTIYVEDLFDIDPETANSLIWILDNQVNDDLQITYTIQDDNLGNKITIPLIQNGENIMVNQSNKKDYVKAVCMYKMTEQIRPQAKAFMQGLEEVVSYDILKCMNYKQFGLYLSGMPKINVQQMKQYAKYNNLQQSQDFVIWFWEVIEQLDQQTLANFLFFVSGSFKVPYGGFKQHPIVLNRGFVAQHLPVAHTCFNTLDLPPYKSKLDLKKKLNIAITQGKGFGVS